MNEFSTDVVFDLQRFANFSGGDIAGEEGVVLSNLFNAAGQAWLLPSDKSRFSDHTYFWESSNSVVDLTPTLDNAEGGTGDGLKLVAGRYDTVTNSDGDEAVVIKSVSVIDAQDLSGTATFSRLNGVTKIINPNSTIKVGSTGAITFDGEGEKEATKDKSIDADQEYEVGTIINVSNGEIKDVEAAKGEDITTADTTHTEFVNGGKATFSNKSFNTIEAFASEDGTAVLNIDSEGDDEKPIVLAIDEFETTAKEGTAAVTVSFDGQAINSIDVKASDTADIQFGGTKVFGKDIAINKGTINVSGLSSNDGSVATYHLNANGSDVLDLMDATIKENKEVAVTKTGNAKFLIAKDDNSEGGTTGLTTIKIGDTNYRFNDADAEAGNGGVFLVSNNKATGFLFRDAGDGIVVSRGMKNFKLYKLAGSGNAASNMLAAEADDLNFDGLDTQEIAINLSIESDSNDYTVEQTDDNGFEIEVKDDTTLKIGDAEIGFKLPSTSSQAKDARTSAIIKINEDGQLVSISAGNKADGSTSEEDASFDVGGIEITFKGMNDSDVIAEGFTIGGVEFATASGEFNYSVEGKEGKESNEVSLDLVNQKDEIITFNDEGAGASTGNVKVTLAPTTSEGEDTPAGEVIYEGMTYKYSSAEGNAYLAPITGEDALKFVFMDEGDALTIPDGGAEYLTPYFYNRLKDVEAEQRLTTLPVIDGEYTINMTQDTDKKHGTAEFEITTAEADTTITFGEGDDAPTFTFSDANGKFFFGQESDSDTVALGFEAASGTVTMNQAAAAYLAPDEDGNAVFAVDGTIVNITAANVESDELVYNKEDKSLAGLGNESAIVNAGSIEKIYAPIDKGTFTFGEGDDAKTYSAEAGSERNRAYFTVLDGVAGSFTFMTDDDELTSNDFSDLVLVDNEAGTSFAAPVVTNADGEGAEATILKTTETIDGKRTKCYTLNEVDLDDKNVEFGDGTKLTFNDANEDTDILFSTEGKLLIIENLDQEGNQVVVSGATGAIRIDDSEVEIVGGGFTFTMLDDDTPTLTDFKAGSNIIKLLKGIDVIQTVGGEEGIGGFTLGSGNEFEVSGTSAGVDGVDFYINSSTDGKSITVAGISDIDGDESVTGALNGVLLNGSTSVAIDGASGTKYTFSGTSFAGLLDGDKVTEASGITDFITGGEGAFEILGTSMAIAGDSKVVFGVDENGALTSITELNGTATGDFNEELAVNTENVKVTGDSSIAVTANDEVVTAIAGVSGADVVFEEIGSASQVATDGDGGFTFIDAGQAFDTFTSDGVVFGIDENTGKVTSIDGIDQFAEGVAGNFDEGISVDGGLVQVINGGFGESGITNIAVINAGESGVGILGLLDGAEVVSASGIVAAVSVQEGTFTFKNGQFTVAGDSMVEFDLDGAGNVIGIDELDENATISGNLNGLTINGGNSILVKDDDTLSYNPNTGLSGVEDTDTVVSADGVSSVFVNGTDFEVEFANGKFTVTGDTDGVVEFLVTGDKSNEVIGVKGLDEGATIEGSLDVLKTINGAEFEVQGDSSFAVVGAVSGISEIQKLSDGANVVKAAGASVAVVDGEGTFTFGGESFGLQNGLGLSVADIDVAGTEFSLNENVKVTAIDNLAVGGHVVGKLNGLAINGGESIDIEGDEGDLGAFAKDDGVAILTGVGSANGVTINNTGGAQRIFTNVSDGKVKFNQSGQEFEVVGETEETADIGGQSFTNRVGVAFTIGDDGKVIEIGQLNGAVRGDFTDGIYVNDPQGEFIPEGETPQPIEQLVKVSGDSSILVKAGEGRVKAIEEVGAGASVENVGGASSVFTNEDGIFAFADDNTPFLVMGDDNVEFQMVAGEAAKVAGISAFADAGDATVTGGLSNLSINGASIAVTGDRDGVLSYEVAGNTKTLGIVGGDDVEINGAGEADAIRTNEGGKYTFNSLISQTYEVNDENGVTFGMNKGSLYVTSISGLSGDVTGDFGYATTKVNGSDIRVDGDEDNSIKVVAENDGTPSRIENFSDGASIIAAEGPSVAIADSDGEFTDASKVQIGVKGGATGATFNLDGHGNFVSVENVEDAIVSGDLGSLSGGVDGKPVDVRYKDSDGEEQQRPVTLAGGVLSGVESGDTVYSADDAAVVRTTESGVFTFGTGDDAQTFIVAGDADGVGFIVEPGTTKVIRVDGLDDGATLVGELNGFTINGGVGVVSIKGDDFYGVVGDLTNGGVKEILFVGADPGSESAAAVTVVSAGGAEKIYTNANGTFTFDNSDQIFKVASDDDGVVFSIDGNESVTAIDDLDGWFVSEDHSVRPATVSGDFSNPIAVNGENINVVGDRDGVSVSSNDETTVLRIDDVDAGATVGATGSATAVGSDGDGIYTFVSGGDTQKFTVQGDPAIDFALAQGSVTGVDKFEDGKLTFNTDNTTKARFDFTVNDTLNDEMDFVSETDVKLTIEDGVVTAVAGLSGADNWNNLAAVNGIKDSIVTFAGLNRNDNIMVNGKTMYVQDYDNDFDVVVEDFEVTKLQRVTGDAIIEVRDGVIETDDEGEFRIGGESYTFVDSDGKMLIKTDENGDLKSVDSLVGSIEINSLVDNGVDTFVPVIDGYEDVTINGNFVEVFSDEQVTISTDGASITAVDGLVDGDIINGDLDNAAIAMKAADGISDPSDLIVNGIHYMLLADDTNDDAAYGNKTGVTVNGNQAVHGVEGLKDGERMLVVDKGTYRVNGTVLEADVNDTIVGADTGAYLYDPDNILVRKSTPLRDIATLTGVPTEIDSVIGSAAAPKTKAELKENFEDETFDLDRRLEIYTTNPDDKFETQTLDFSGNKFTKKVHLYDGLQDLVFNSEGGNVAHIARQNPNNDNRFTSGVKNITLGGGSTDNPYGAGDLVIVDETDGIDNQVNILGGAGNDTVFVRDNVRTVFDASKGGKDRIVTFAGANAQIQIENYNASTGAGIQFDQWELQTPKDPTGRNKAEGNKIADAITSKLIQFGDGVVSLVSESGTVEVSLNSEDGGTASVGGSIVNLYTPEGKKQVVGFSHSAGSQMPVDASAFDDDLILIGNNEGKKLGGSTLLGGDGNDTVYAGEHDAINAGAGNNVVSLEADALREGAEITIAAGNTTIYNMNNTLDEIHGDTLAVDLTNLELEFDGTNLIVKSKDEDEYNATNVYAVVVDADKDTSLVYDTATDTTSTLASSADDADETTAESVASVAVASPLVPNHNYTNQIIRSSGETVWKAAIGAEGSVIDVKLDEDVRANYYKGENSGLTFGAYNGNVLIDLEGDWQASNIDGVGVYIEGINSIQAGIGENIIKGSDANETFFAGRGNTYLYGDGGKNLMVGYDNTNNDKEGQTTFYVLGHAADGVNTIQSFAFVNDDNYTNNSRITADILNFDLPTNYVSRVALSQNEELEYNDVVVEVTNRDGSGTTESVIIKGAKGKDILISGDGVVPYDVIAQIGDDQLTFDKFANYYNATGKNATLTVTNDKDVANVWLDKDAAAANGVVTGVDFQGDIKVIDASDFVGLAELAGNDYDNTIIAGNGQTSLWGGNHGDDLLVASESGKDTFYYTLGNGTDTIYGAKDGDVVDLAGVTLDQIASTEFSGSSDPIQGVAINFKDGGKLYIGDNGGNDVQYKVGGETYYVNEEHNGWVKKA